MSVTRRGGQTGSTRVKLVGVDPGLVAGKARDGGGAQDSSMGHRSRRRWAVRVAGTTARLLVAVVGPGVAGVDDGELGCGRRSSGGHGLAAVTCK